MEEVGKVTHYYTNIEVGVVELSDALKTSDQIHIKGTTTNFEQKVESMQIEGKDVQEAQKGEAIGLKVKKRVREDDIVYKMV